eukprot:2601302-Rhodomonas_salina.1
MTVPEVSVEPEWYPGNVPKLERSVDLFGVGLRSQVQVRNRKISCRFCQYPGGVRGARRETATHQGTRVGIPKPEDLRARLLGLSYPGTAEYSRCLVRLKGICQRFGMHLGIGEPEPLQRECRFLIVYIWASHPRYP